jgi:hypothetical protein
MHGRFLKFLIAFDLTLIIAAVIQSASDQVWPDELIGQFIVTSACTLFIYSIAHVIVHIVLLVVALVSFGPIHNSIINAVQTFASSTLGVEVSTNMIIAIMCIVILLLFLFLFLLHYNRVHKMFYIGILSLIGSFVIAISISTLRISFKTPGTPHFDCDEIAIQDNNETEQRQHPEGNYCPLTLDIYEFIIFGFSFAVLMRMMWTADSKFGKLPTNNNKNKNDAVYTEKDIKLDKNETEQLTKVDTV